MENVLFILWVQTVANWPVGSHAEGEGTSLLRVFLGIVEGVLLMEETDALRARKTVG